MEPLKDQIQDKFPFISIIQYGGDEFVGIIINQDSYVTSFFDLSSLRTPEDRAALLELGEIWWWESNRSIPLTIFLRNEVAPYQYASKSLNTKDVKIVFGPVVNLANLSVKRVKRKNVQLVRKSK